MKSSTMPVTTTWTGSATFLHNLTEALTHQAAAAMVVSLPMSDSEAGGERGVRTPGCPGEHSQQRPLSVLEVGQASEDDGYAVVTASSV